MQKAILFDLDGTLTDSGEGIINSVIPALEHFGLKVAYNVTWNSEPPESAPEHTDRRTTLSLGYSM